MITCASPRASTPSVPGRDGHPLVGIRAGLRHAGFDLHERSAHAGPALPHLAVADALRHGRVPRAEEISAEAEDVPRVRQIEGRQLLAAEAQRIGTAQHLVAEQLVGDRPGRAEPREKLLDQRTRDGSAPPRVQERERPLVAGALRARSAATRPRRSRRPRRSPRIGHRHARRRA